MKLIRRNQVSSTKLSVFIQGTFKPPPAPLIYTMGIREGGGGKLSNYKTSNLTSRGDPQQNRLSMSGSTPSSRASWDLRTLIHSILDNCWVQSSILNISWVQVPIINICWVQLTILNVCLFQLTILNNYWVQLTI